jgi:hypothetical protein
MPNYVLSQIPFVAKQIGDTLVWDGEQWVPGTPAGGGTVTIPFADQLRVRPITVEGVMLGATTVQGAIERLLRVVMTGAPGAVEPPPTLPGQPSESMFSNAQFLEWTLGPGPFSLTTGMSAIITADLWYIYFQINSGWEGGSSITAERHTMTGGDHTELAAAGGDTTLAEFALRVDVLGNTTSGDAHRSQILTSVLDLALVLEKLIEVSFYAKASAPMDTGVRLALKYNDGNSDVANIATETVSITTTWEHYVLQFDLRTMALNPNYLLAGNWTQVEWNLSSDNIGQAGVDTQTGTFYFWDMVFRDVTP